MILRRSIQPDVPSTPQNRVAARKNISLAADAGDPAYEENIQVADVNALNAIIGIIRWKKHCGIYVDAYSEHHTVFDLDAGLMHHNHKREEQADET